MALNKTSKKVGVFGSPGRFDGTGTVHLPEPDYTRPRLELSDQTRERIHRRLKFLYGPEETKTAMPELERILKVYYAHKPEELIEREKRFRPEDRFTEEDVVLITYGDLIHDPGRSPLSVLAEFCDNYLEGTINTLHILPFFPYSSDRGFSVIDFKTVDPNLGSWEDIEMLESKFMLMFDGVFNHVSSKNLWFQEFLDGNPERLEYFISYKSPDDLTPEQRRLIFRPRTSDILSEYQTLNGPRWVWTTFSRDQIDLNFKNPQVLLKVLEVLLTYVRRGAEIIRLDAVTYLWNEPGTSCIHLAQTHEIVKLFRDVLDAVAPTVAILTETNVPHEENVSYFGTGSDEAQMVYNFALPPLVLHTFYTQDVTRLSEWATELKAPSPTTTFFNFLDSHDGVGLMAVKNILSREERDFIVAKAIEYGGLVSYKTSSRGDREPYEINETWYSALNPPDPNTEHQAENIARYVASRSIALVLAGVPAFYLHGLLGTRNDVEAVSAGASNRAINRTVLDYQSLQRAMHDPWSKISAIDRELGGLILLRTKRRAFHPNGAQQVLFIDPRVFSVMRISPEEDQHVLCLTNVSDQTVLLDIGTESLPHTDEWWFDLAGGRPYQTEDGRLAIQLPPYGVAWLEPSVELKNGVNHRQ